MVIGYIEISRVGMWPIITAMARTYAPQIVLPAAMVAGFIGYNLEDWLSDKHTPSRKSAIERREERRANEGEADYQVPKTIFERNVSPGLERKD